MQTPVKSQNKPFVVLKFGGTSVSSPEKWKTIAHIARARVKSGYKPVIVCSALSQISNQLEEAIRQAISGRDIQKSIDAFRGRHEAIDGSRIECGMTADLSRLLNGIQLLGECSPKIRAQILSIGELCASKLGEKILHSMDIRASWLDARKIIQSNNYQNRSDQKHYLDSESPAEYDQDLVKKLQRDEAQAFITQGFIGGDSNGNTVLFGRGGSDTSAAYLSRMIGAKRCEIWTDVPGLFTANPKQIPSARLLNRISYKEAQEIATNGAKILHPRSIAPLKHAGIPLAIRDTHQPELPGTWVEDRKLDVEPGVKAIAIKRPTHLLSVESMQMWNEVGFLAEFFGLFKAHGFSVDLISTSETNLTVTIDREPGDEHRYQQLKEGLITYGCVKSRGECASISLIGLAIRSILPRISSSLNIFEDYPIHLLTQAANDLSLTYVVNDEHADKIASELHQLLFSGSLSAKTFGPTLGDLAPKPGHPHEGGDPSPWWQHKREKLIQMAETQTPAYVYDLDTVKERISELNNVGSLNRIFYAIKANPHSAILDAVHSGGLGFECVSKEEIQHVLYQFPNLDPKRILFTPNFGPIEEFGYAFDLGCHVTLDNLNPLQVHPEYFSNKAVLLRVDPGKGQGHHRHVITAGKQSKFGIPPEELDRARLLLESLGSKIVGLHAHAGSGIYRAEHWKQMGIFLTRMKDGIGPDLKYINLGGGLGIPYRPEDPRLDLKELDASLSAFKRSFSDIEIWMEPGRYIAAECGIILSKVTQLKNKGDICYVGVDAGMNSLMRPALYGAYHHIENLSKVGARKEMTANVVGPICETGDTLGFARSLPKTDVGDVMLIENAGAYGRVMASSYNLRPPAVEIVLGG